MNWFKKKEQPKPTPIQVECKHIWQDFPWYMEADYSSSCSHIQIKETYVCRLCHKTLTKTLFDLTDYNISRKQHNAKIEAVLNKYREYIKPYAIVQDMIYDTLLVDREKIKIWERLYGSNGTD